MQPIDVFIAFLVLWVAFLLCMMVSSLFLRAPYVPTPWKVAKSMVDFADLHGHEVVYDLGAGDGRLLISALKKHPHITAIGFELSFPVYLWGLCTIWYSRTPVKLFMRNFFHQNVCNADCIFLYLMPGAMKTLQKKFEKELRPGTKIVSHAFTFPDRTPVKTMPVPWLSGTKNVMLYVW